MRTTPTLLSLAFAFSLMIECNTFSRLPGCPSTLVQIQNVENTVVKGDLTLIQGPQGVQFYTARSAPLREVFPVTQMTQWGPRSFMVNVSHLEGFGIERTFEDAGQNAVSACQENVRTFLLQSGINMIDNSLVCVIKARKTCVS